MRLLLDTHAFLWWIADDPRLSPRARSAIATRKDQCFFSLASGWEIAIKIAQALAERLVIVSADPVFRRYGVKRVW